MRMTGTLPLAREMSPDEGDRGRYHLTRYWPVAIAYLVIGLLAYARIIATFFVADDFSYLDVISRAHSPAVIFSPLAERYFRPAVVFVYYLNYQISGLTPWTYHLSVVLIHIANAWLVFVLGLTIAPTGRPFVAGLAGLLFLVFGGHAEAVTWIGGMADPLLTLCLLTALLLFIRGLEAARPLPWLVGSWGAFVAALLTKESAAVFLGLAAAFTLLAAPGWPSWPRLRRAGLALIPPVLLLVAYFGLRRMILGFTFVDLHGLGTSTNLAATARAFVLRSFFPHSAVLSRVWNSFLDVYVIVPAVLALFWFVRRDAYRGLALAAVCLGLTIAPVLPLSIGIARPDSERFIYLPSAFSCLLLVLFLSAALRRRWLVATVVVLCSAGHLVALDRINRRWVAAATATRGITTSFRQLVEQHGGAGLPVFVLNVPDSVNGAYVYRRGFTESLLLAAPNQAPLNVTGIYALSVYTILDASVPPVAVQTTSTRFELNLGAGELIGDKPPPTSFYTINEWSRNRLSVDFAYPGSALIVYFTPQDAKLAAVLAGGALPFGYIDLPASGSGCGTTQIEVMGWALAKDPIGRVSISVRADSAGSPPAPIWETTRVARPDVAAVFPTYREAPLAGWRGVVPCVSLAPYARDGGVDLVVTAEHSGGKSYVIGERRILIPR